MREIVLDTETTGFEPSEGHRLVEIGCVEIINKIPTGKTYHQYINPERDMPIDAFNVHGISEEFLSDKPLFAKVAQEFLDFVGSDPMIIHNAAFDMKFLNAELEMVNMFKLPMDQTIDTLAIARKKYPGSPVTLDALCRRFEIDNSNRTYHGALLDSELLADVYLELSGGRQHGLTLNEQNASGADKNQISIEAQKLIQQKEKREPRPFKASDEELNAHKEMLGSLTDPIWSKPT